MSRGAGPGRLQVARRHGVEVGAHGALPCTRVSSPHPLCPLSPLSPSSLCFCHWRAPVPFKCRFVCLFKSLSFPSLGSSPCMAPPPPDRIHPYPNCASPSLPLQHLFLCLQITLGQLRAQGIAQSRSSGRVGGIIALALSGSCVDSASPRNALS